MSCLCDSLSLTGHIIETNFKWAELVHISGLP